jgi:serine/threonine-protein kinase
MLSADDLDFQAALAGQYSLERELGRGGMGIVYLGREVLLDRAVAIKRLPLPFAEDADARERFVREAKTAAQLFHPHVVPIYRVDRLGAHVFFAMAYVDGETVGQLVRRRGPLPVNVATRILREAAWALGYGHARGVVHRDVKPDNLLVERESGRTLVTDFGIAYRAGASALTRDGQLIGSVHYMSPEQINGRTVDGRSDVYALGALAHFLLTGKPPFDSNAATAVLGKHLNEPAPPIASRVPRLPRRLAEAIDRCLAKDPSARFATAEAFAEELNDVETRRAIAAPLRAWVKGAGLADPGLFFIGAVSFWSIVKTENFWLLAVPAGYSLLQRLRATRRMIASGYDGDDLSGALAAEIERRSEEAESHFEPPSRAVRLLRKAAVVGVGTFGVLVATLFWMDAFVYMNRTNIAGFIYGVMELVAGGALAAGVVGGLIGEAIAPSRVLDRMDSVGLKWRLKFWRSNVGGALARLLQRSVRRVARADADHPTEVIVGAAAASLFEALPRELRKEFAALPAVVAQLELRARSLRAKRQKMDSLASEAALPVRAKDSDGVERLRMETVGHLQATREAVDQQLGTTIAALETLRLDLLRLHAGRGSTADLTAALNACAAIGEDVSTTLSSRAAVERLLANSGPV